MAQYGELLTGFDPFKDEMYKLFDTYFERPILTKIKNINNYSMYLIKMHSMLAREFRYLIVFVPKDDYRFGHTSP